MQNSRPAPTADSLRHHHHSSWGFGEVLRLSAPMSLALISGTIVRFVDGWMVAGVSANQFSAQFVGGLASFVIEAFAVGALGVVSTFVSQSFGAERPRRCGQYAWAGMHLAWLFALAMLPLLLLSGPLMGLFGHGPTLVAMEGMYFRYMVLGFLMTIPARAVEQFFIGIHLPRVVYIAAIIGNLFNVGANYCLIYGKFGLPRLELEGAAIGSCISWGLQLAILMSVFLSHTMHVRYGTRRLRPIQWRRIGQIVRLGLPVGGRFANAMLCWSIFSNYFVGGFSKAHLAGNAVAMRYGLVAILPIVGIGMATTALVGRYIGAGRPDLARKRTHTALLVGAMYLAVITTATVIYREPMVKFFVSGTSPVQIEVAPDAADADEPEPDEIIRIGTRLLLLLLVVQWFDSGNIIYIGALRGAGDTKRPMILAMTLAWILEVGGSALMVAVAPQWEGRGPYFAAAFYMFCATIYMMQRFEAGHWRKINLFADTPSPSGV